MEFEKRLVELERTITSTFGWDNVLQAARETGWRFDDNGRYASISDASITLAVDEMVRDGRVRDKIARTGSEGLRSAEILQVQRLVKEGTLSKGTVALISDRTLNCTNSAVDFVRNRKSDPERFTPAAKRVRRVSTKTSCKAYDETFLAKPDFLATSPDNLAISGAKLKAKVDAAAGAKNGKAAKVQKKLAKETQWKNLQAEFPGQEIDAFKGNVAAFLRGGKELIWAKNAIVRGLAREAKKSEAAAAESDKVIEYAV
jgi:hypothetical protein